MDFINCNKLYYFFLLQCDFEMGCIDFIILIKNAILWFGYPNTYTMKLVLITDMWAIIDNRIDKIQYLNSNFLTSIGFRKKTSILIS